jgi:quercetin dioxygenase-like cupin family protein
MIIKKCSEAPIEKIIEKGVSGVSKQMLLGPEDGAPTFAMRRFTVEPGGYTFYHTHDFEHEVYVLAGKGIARSDSGETEIIADTAVLVKPNDVHQFVNTGQDDLVFLCIIPNPD